MLHSTISNGQFYFSVFNIHNSYIHSGNFSIFKSSLNKTLEDSHKISHFHLLLGDFNVAPQGQNDIDLHHPLSPFVPRHNYNTREQEWNTIIAHHTEVCFNEPTHITPDSGRLSYIDRFFYSMPSWAVNLLDFNSSFYARPSTLSTLGLSDHAILSVTISSKANSKASRKAISLDLIKTPIFKSALDSAMRLKNWYAFPFSSMIHEMNETIYEIANYVKNLLHNMFDTVTWDSLSKLVTHDQNAFYMYHQYLNIASRLVWQNNVELANKYIHKHHILQGLLSINNSKVSLKDPNTFSLKCQQAKHEAITRSMGNVSKAISSATSPTKAQTRFKNTLKKLAKAAKKWLPVGKFYI